MDQKTRKKRGAPIKHGRRAAEAMEAIRARGAFYRLCRETMKMVKEACQQQSNSVKNTDM